MPLADTLVKFSAAVAANDGNALADLFTEDAVYIDPAWGRIEGRDEIALALVDRMIEAQRADPGHRARAFGLVFDKEVDAWTRLIPRSRRVHARSLMSMLAKPSKRQGRRTHREASTTMLAKRRFRP